MPIDETKKECDAFLDMVLQYAKKHHFSYVISIGKRVDESNNIACMDNFHERWEGDLERVVRNLVTQGPISIALVKAILEEGQQIKARKTQRAN